MADTQKQPQTREQAPGRGPLASLARVTGLGRLWLWLERAWPALWPGIGVLAAYAGFSLLAPWRYLPFWLHSLVLAMALLAAGYFFYRGIRAIRPPRERDIRERLQRENRLAGRPLDILADHMAQGNSRTSAHLWRAAKKKAGGEMQSIKGFLPRAGLQRIDSRGLRLGIALLFVIGFAVAGASWPDRLRNGFAFEFSQSPDQVMLDVWLTPPDYTGLSPRPLYSGRLADHERSSDTIEAPEGSILTVTLRTSETEPVLRLGRTRADIYETENGSLEAAIPVHESGPVTVRVGRHLSLRWPLTLIPDRAPTVSFSETPGGTPRAALEVEYHAADDYGLEGAVMTLTRAGLSTAEPQEFSLPLPPGTSGEQTGYLDLAPHPWAGMTVDARIRVRDALGQDGTSAPVRFILPEREFTHPVARQLIAIRKTLIFSPERADAAQRLLDIQSKRPGDFDNDLAVYSALTSSYWRLKLNEDGQAVGDTIDTLWDTAVYIEDGGLSLAERNLRAMFDQMRDALSGDESTDFDQLANQLTRAMAEFLQSQIQQAGEPQQARSMPGGEMQVINTATLDAMIQQMRDLAAAGRMDEAREILEQLQSLMENMQTPSMANQDFNRIMEGTRAMNALQSLEIQQQDLRARTMRESLMAPLREDDSPVTNENFRRLSGDQAALAEQLQQVMQSLQEAGMEAPEALQQAMQAMQGAGADLEARSGRTATEAQRQAEQALREGFEALNQEMSDALAQARAMSSARDPMGRSGAQTSSDELIIPDGEDISAAQRILDLLRERLSDPSRGETEIEYLRRLLRRF